MAVSMSIKMVVVIALCAVMLISGSVLVWKVVEMRNIVSAVPMPGKVGNIRVEVVPESSQQGTLFFVRARYLEEREQQDLRLNVVGQNYADSIIVYDDGKHFDGGPNDGVYGGYFDSEGKQAGKYEIRVEDIDDFLASFLVNEPGCELIEGEYNGKQINFVILPYGYSNYDDFKEDAKKLISGRESLLDTEPFKSNEDKLAFFIVNTTRNFECEVGCKNVSTLVCCNNKKVVEEAARCDYDSILVLVNSNEECGSASYYAKLCSGNSYANLVLIHELGHSFGDLADEYVYADYFGDYAVGEVDEFNCDGEGCGKWKNISEGCFHGCTYSNLYRPSEKNSIMYDLYPQFNEVCEKHIQDLIDNYNEDKNFKEVSDKSYFVNLKYNNGAISFDNVFLKPVKSWQDFRKSDYSIEVVGKNGQIFNSSLYVPDKTFPIPPNGTIVYEEDFDFSLAIPYSEEAEEIKIYREDRPVASAKFKLLSEGCGDGKCDGSETRLSCVVDCGILDDFCETNSCDPDCPSQKNCNRNEQIIWISVAVLLVGGFLLMTFMTAWMTTR